VHPITIYGVDPAGNTSSSVQTSITIDNTAPVVTLTSTPPNPSASSAASVSFSVNDPSAQAWCSLDGGTAQACAGTVSYTGLGNGSHTISVYAIDQAGNIGASASTTFLVAAAAPVFTSTPSGITLGVATYTWTAVPGFTYQYSFNGTTWTTTSSTSSNTSINLIPGSYTFRLRGTDSHGNHTAIATAASFSVL
jgi:large repetitive protein